jgi:ribonuclease HI
MELLLEAGAEAVEVFGDSKLVISQLTEEYRCESELLFPLWVQCVAKPLELFRLKCTIDRRSIAIRSMHFKRNNPLVYRVSTRYNHGSAGSKQVYLARRRVHITK